MLNEVAARHVQRKFNVTQPEISSGAVRIARDARGARTSYDDLEIGKDLGSTEFVFTQLEIDQTCARLKDHHPYYELNSPLGGTVCPVYMTYWLTRMLFSETYSVRGLFYKWGFELFEPVRPGVKYSLSGRLTEKWIKNDREFVSYESVCKDPQGKLVFTTRRAHTLDFIKRTAPKSGENGIDSSDARSPTAKAARVRVWEPADWVDGTSAAGTGNAVVRPLANADMPAGTPLPSISVFFSQQEFERRWKPRKAGANRTLHIEPDAAKQEGLPAPVAGAPDIMALLFRSALHFFGVGWIQGGKAELTSSRPTFPGDYLTTGGVVRDREMLADGSTRLICDVWIENQAGEKKVVGTIGGIAPH